MSLIVSIADDLTGANALAAALVSEGLTTYTVDHWSAVESAALLDIVDAVVCNTDSRTCHPDEAAQQVTHAVWQWWREGAISKRIDSTLRGPIGAELAAFISEVGRLGRKRCVALLVAAHPGVGRTTRHGTQFIHGRVLSESTVWRGGIDAPSTSELLPIVTLDNDLRAVHIDISTVLAGSEAIATELVRAADTGADVIVIDATELSHIDVIAGAAVRSRQARPGIQWASVDPGPFTAAVVRAMMSGASPARPTLAVIGSASALTRTQVEHLESERSVRVLSVLGPDARVRDATLVQRELGDAISSAEADSVIALISASEAGDVDAAISCTIPGAFARAVRSVAGSPMVGSLLLTGGDVASTVLRAVGAWGTRVQGEVEPLAVFGTLVGGPWSGLPFCTKGGQVGDDRTLLRCIDRLRDRAVAPETLRPLVSTHVRKEP